MPPSPSRKPNTKADTPLAAALNIVAARTSTTVAAARKPVIEAARNGRLVIFGNSWPQAATWSPIPSTYWTVAGIQLSACLIPGSDDVCSERTNSAEPNFRPFYRLRVDGHQLESLWPPLGLKKNR